MDLLLIVILISSMCCLVLYVGNRKSADKRRPQVVTLHFQSGAARARKRKMKGGII